MNWKSKFRTWSDCGGELERVLPRRWLEARYDVRRYTELARGGHFAAVDAPDLFLEDVRAFFRELR